MPTAASDLVPPLDPAPAAASTSRTAGRARSAAYWVLTLFVAFEMAAGALWDLLRIEFVRGVFDHLGYPHYLLTIIGVWKLPCAATLLAPGLPRLKEWAYAGAFFLYTGAAASHFSAGDHADKFVGPAVFGAFTLASYLLRPDDRRSGARAAPPRPAAWLATVGTLVLFVVIALLTLPKGPPPP
jgi:DoxX-like family